MEKKTVKLEKKAAKLNKKNSGFNAPDFDSMLLPYGMDGLPEREVSSAEETAAQEVDDMMTQIRENRKSNAERFRDIEAGEFWFCVCFQSRSQKEEFLAKFLDRFNPGNASFGDKYVSGLELAALLNIPVEPIFLEAKKSRLAPKSMRGIEVI